MSIALPKITPAMAAELAGKSAQFIRIGMQRNLLDPPVSCCCGVIMGVELEDGCELVDGWRATFNTMEEAIEAWNRRIENE